MSGLWRLLGVPVGVIVGVASSDVWAGLISGVAVTAGVVVIGQMREDQEKR